MTTVLWQRLKMVARAALVFLATALLPAAAFAGALDRIHQDNVIHIAYRADAPPFSYKTATANLPASWSICARRSFGGLRSN